MKTDAIRQTKQCCKCRKIYPATHLYFARDKSTNDGFCAACKVCANERLRKHRAENPEKSREASRRSRNKDIEKSRARERDYRSKNVDKRRDYDKEYHAKNRVRIIVRKRKHYAVNREAIRQAQRDWYKNNAEKMQARSREDRLRNPDRTRSASQSYWLGHQDQWQIYNQRRLARKRSLPDTFTSEQWKLALTWWDHRCAYCRIQPSKLTMDHYVALSNPVCPGTIAENILPACQHCNRRKNKSDAVKWITRQFGEIEGLEIQCRIDAYFKWITMTNG